MVFSLEHTPNGVAHIALTVPRLDRALTEPVALTGFQPRLLWHPIPGHMSRACERYVS